MEHIPLNLDQSPTQTPRMLYDGAVQAFQSGRLAKAERDLTNLLDISTATQAEVLQALLLRGQVRMAAERIPDAVEDWKAVVAICPGHIAAMTNLYGENYKQRQPLFVPPASPLIDLNIGGDVRPVHAPTRIFGRIKVTHRQMGTTIGYVSLKDQKYCHVAKKIKSGVIISGVSLPAPFALTLGDTTEASATYPYLGFVSASLPDGQEYAVLTRTGHTPPGSLPKAIGNAVNMSAPAESTVWRYDPTTQRLTAKWINGDGTPRTNSLCYSEHHKALFLPSDLARYKTVVHDIYLVDLTVVQE